jgi:hypothetical protein
MTLPQDALDSARDAYDSAWLSTHGSHAKSIAAAIEAYLAADTPRTESSPLDDEWEPARTLAARLRSPRPQTGEENSGGEADGVSVSREWLITLRENLSEENFSDERAEIQRLLSPPTKKE